MLKRLLNISLLLGMICPGFMVAADKALANVPEGDDVHFVIVIPSYNNKEWYEKNLDSALEQTYKNYHVVYINDASTDGTGDLVAAYVRKKDIDKKVTLLSNKKRNGALANIYHVVHNCADNDVIVLLDGDDWLAHRNVLKRLYDSYAHKKKWLVYSQFAFWPGIEVGWNRAFSTRQYKNSTSARNYSPSHLRTFYAGLFKKIKHADLMHEGDFFAMTWDMAIMLPMVEMASDGHVQFIDETMYIYNNSNPLSDHRIDLELQRKLSGIITAKKKYNPLKSLDDSNIELLQSDTHFVIIVSSYNNKQWCQKNLDSIFMQTYKNYDVIYINDASTDGSQDLVDAYVRSIDTEHKITLLNNLKQQGKLANIHHAVHHCDDNDVIVVLDGNDCFAHENVLAALSITYANKVNWLVCSASQAYDEQLGVVGDLSDARLLTFYALLFKKVHSDDLQCQGKFFTQHFDVAMYAPMAAMATKKHTNFLKQSLVCHQTTSAECASEYLKSPYIAHLRSAAKKYVPCNWLVDDTIADIQAKEDTHFVIIIPSYNNKDWYQRNLDSVLMQKYSQYRVVYINDCSADGTGDLVAQYSRENDLANRMVLIDNNKRIGALANIYNAVHACKSNEVVILLDGDDWLPHENVLSILNNAYADKKNWLIYSQFLQWPVNEIGWNRQFPKKDYQDFTVPREYSPSHLRTFYAGLFHKIKREDLMYEGDFFVMTWDMAIMLPMVEMASDGHVCFIPDVLYTYNLSNPISDHRVDLSLQEKLHSIIARKNKYLPLHCLCEAQVNECVREIV